MTPSTPQPPPDAIRASLGAAGIESFRKHILAKNASRLVPILALAYVISYLDRSNVGFAGLTMRKELGLSATQFGWGAGIFVIGYCAFAVPSNVGLYRLGARRWLASIMIAWGLLAGVTAFVVGPRSFYALRFLLGVAEAGFVPGVVYYLTLWFPEKFRTQVLAWFMVALPISFFVGGPLSGYLVGVNGIFGLSGWQWMFIVEGVPAGIVGVILFFVLKNEPKDATWLSAEERGELATVLSEDRSDRASAKLLDALKDPRVLILTGISFGFTSGSNGIGIWLPQILKDYKLSNVQIGFVSAVPYFFATVGMLAWAWYVDRTGHRIRNLTGACLLSAVAFAVSLFFTTILPSLILFAVALIGISSARAIFFTVPQRFLTGAALASGLAFINAVASVGGFVGPFAVGWLKDKTGNFQSGMLAMASMLVLATGLSLSLSVLSKED
ncbi:MAG: MFS transporter [Candidatus Acidiferrales bacterium]